MKPFSHDKSIQQAVIYTCKCSLIFSIGYNIKDFTDPLIYLHSTNVIYVRDKKHIWVRISQVSLSVYLYFKWGFSQLYIIKAILEPQFIMPQPLFWKYWHPDFFPEMTGSASLWFIFSPFYIRWATPPKHSL